jgi:hypothetical protein
MTLILFASIAGAALFFAAGAALMALRSRRTTDDVATQVQEGPTLVRRVDPELARLRAALAAAEATVASQATVLDEQNRLWERETDDKHAVVTRELAKLRADNDRLHKEVLAAAATNQELRRTAEERAKQLEAATATNQELRRTAEDRAKLIDRTRTDAVASATELTQLQTKLRDVERQLADKIASARDLSTENEQLKGRLRDADALRAEYVRLRTATTESEFLKSEIARLQQELRALKVDALGARGAQPAPRPARGTDRQVTAVQRTIGESLARVIERFADDGTRSSALADKQGFPLASSGADGLALAAYAAHLFESASRARDYLPVTAPSAIEIVDTNGVRVSLWSLDVESDHLVLANLAVSPVDAKRVEATLGDLTQILAPSAVRHTATP